MKTTIDVSDALLREAKRIAAREGTTLRSLVEEGLREAVERHKSGPAKRKPFKMVTYGSGGLRPGVDLRNWEQIRSLIYEGRGE